MRWPPSSLVVLRIEGPIKIVEIVVSGALGGGARAGEVGIIMAQPPLEGWLGGQPSTRQKTPRILGPTRILTPKAVPLLLSKGIIPTDKAQAKMKVSTRLRWEESLSFCRK